MFTASPKQNEEEMTATIHIIGTVNNESIFTIQHINHLLNQQRTELSHGETFTGRPGTQIYLDEQAVLKIHSEMKLAVKDAKKWAQHALEKERKYNVYHPHKMWFIAEIENQDTALIGNICPRLQPLHHLFSQTDSDAIEQYLDLFEQVYDLYFRLAYEHKARLDEGLSNFGVDVQGKVFYLDDDIYIWDKFMTCAHMLGVYFRSLTWLTKTEDAAKKLGNIVRQQILTHFQDKHCLYVLTEQLRDVFMPATVQQNALQCFSKALHQDAPKRIRKPLRNTRYLALMSDVHANLPALEIVLEYLKKENIQQGIILGDIVGYGPYPSECIERLQETEFEIVKGNHDHGLATDNFSKGFSTVAKWALDWSRDKVSAEQKQWLADLPPILYGDNWLAVHGAPIDPTFFNAYVYAMTYEDNLNVLQKKHIPFCFHGHTHLPGIYARRKVIDKHILKAEVDISQYDYSLICPGAIGQPRNNKVGAQFAIFDLETKKLTFKNLVYDLESIINYMQQQSFPTLLMQMLEGKPE